VNRTYRSRKWIITVAARFLKTKHRQGGVTPALVSIVGLMVGVLTLLSVLAVMNGFQLGFIEDILEISSYHVRLYTSGEQPEYKVLERVRELAMVEAATPFVDIQTMIEGPYSGLKGSNVRGIEDNTPSFDKGWARQINLEDAYAVPDLDRTKIVPGTIWLGEVLAETLGVTVGERVSILSMAGDSFTGLLPARQQFTVELIFSSGYYDYDAALAFIGLEEIRTISSGKEELTIGIKLRDRWKDRQFLQLLAGSEILPEEMTAESWRSYNRSFFGALRMEKLAMMLIIGIVFVVVGVNIKHSLERSVWEKREAIGLLRSIGASPGEIKTIFLIDGAIIGAAGGGTGTLLGLLVSGNINALFLITEKAINFLQQFATMLLRPFFPVSPGESFTLFSPAYFYLQEIPSRIMYYEVLMVFLFSFCASLLAAWTASRAISDFDPAEILRYE
jgi:lipoprotein-releasing system permease protein